MQKPLQRINPSFYLTHPTLLRKFSVICYAQQVNPQECVTKRLFTPIDCHRETAPSPFFSQSAKCQHSTQRGRSQESRVHTLLIAAVTGHDRFLCSVWVKVQMEITNVSCKPTGVVIAGNSDPHVGLRHGREWECVCVCVWGGRLVRPQVSQ